MKREAPFRTAKPSLLVNLLDINIVVQLLFLAAFASFYFSINSIYFLLISVSITLLIIVSAYKTIIFQKAMNRDANARYNLATTLKKLNLTKKYRR